MSISRSEMSALDKLIFHDLERDIINYKYKMYKKSGDEILRYEIEYMEISGGTPFHKTKFIDKELSLFYLKKLRELKIKRLN